MALVVATVQLPLRSTDQNAAVSGDQNGAWASSMCGERSSLTLDTARAVAVQHGFVFPGVMVHAPDAKRANLAGEAVAFDKCAAGLVSSPSIGLVCSILSSVSVNSRSGAEGWATATFAIV